MYRICFLFNHDQIHQIAHSLPIAMRMVEMERVEVTLALGDERLERHVRDIAGDLIERFRIVQLALRRRTSVTLERTLNRALPARKILLYRDNLEFFRSFDALVVSEKTSLLLKTRYGLDRLKIVHTRHGAGDRAIGFNRESALFDLVLVSGPKIARRLTEQAGVDPARIRTIGYPKFDLFAEQRRPSPFGDCQRPTVLYAPHPSPKLSSYYRMGRSVVESIARSGKYNLLFAPHVMLMQRRFALTISPPAISRVPRPNPSDLDPHRVHFDPGSGASADMSYTNMADLYLGDVSSQIYEFMVRPRPCVHLNAHGIEWQDNADFTHWQTGPVIGPGDDVVEAIDAAIASFPEYEPRQRELFADTFSVTDEAAGLRGARAIVEFLDGV